MSWPAVYTGLSWTPAEAKPNLSQLYLSWLSLAKPAKLNFFKTPASDPQGGGQDYLTEPASCLLGSATGQSDADRRAEKVEN